MKVLSGLVVAWLVLAGVALVAHAASVKAGKEVSVAEQIEFEQQKAQAHMQELQERMFRLAELTRDLEPDDSARLLLAVQKAREQLIIEQMKDALTLLGKKDLGESVTQQKEVLRKLEELKALLLSTDLDFQIKLDRLRKLDAILKKLDPAIKEQDRQQHQSGELEKKQAQEQLDKKSLENAKTDQERNHKANDAIQEMVKELGPNSAAAGNDLQNAGGAMGGAEGKLGEQKPGEAKKDQKDAADKMKDARKKLQDERDKLLKEIEKQVREQVVENLTEMLERQKKVRESTQALAPKVAAGQHESLLGVQRLSPTEDRIVLLCDQTVTLIEETKFSFALPPALRSIQRRMIFVSGDLKAGRANDSVIASEKMIEADLADLIDAVKESAPNPSDKDGEGECKSCGGSKNKLLAELKIVRLLQVRVNEETVDVDGQRAKAEAELPAELKDKVGTVRDHQEQVRDAMDQLHRASCPDCLNDGGV